MLLSQTLEYLLDIESPFKSSLLYGLSKLESEEVERLRDTWPLIPLARRRRLVKELIEIAETNFEVDFDAVFRWGLQDDDPEVREASIEGLWENEEPALMTEFLHLLQNDPSIPVRAAAALALGRFMLLGELQTLPADRHQPAYEALCAVFQDQAEPIEVRRRALEAVAYVSDEQVAALLQKAYDHPDDQMRLSAIFGMGRSADARWINTVIEGLYSVYPEIRYEAARACGELEAREAVPKLAVLIEDPDREVQQAALWALGQIGGDEARRLLQICVQAGDEVICDAAEDALAELELMHSQLDFPFHALGPSHDANAEPFS
jgi:HEAT repeat protein